MTRDIRHGFKVGDKVFWNDPDGSTSGPGTVAHVQNEEEDAIISLAMDDGGEVEALPHELEVAP
jgi:hypothetical protein